MEKVKKILLSTDLYVLVLVLIGLRIAVSGASIGDALAILSLCCLKGFHRWIESRKKESINDQLAKELLDLKSMVTSMHIKQSVKPNPAPINPDLKRFF